MPLLSLLPASAGAIQIVPVSQERSVVAVAQVTAAGASDSESVEREAPGFGRFDESVAASASLPGASGIAEAAQDSQIGPIGIRADGSARVEGKSDLLGSGGALLGESSLQIVYRTMGQPRQLSGTISVDGTTDAFASLLVEAVLPDRDVELAIFQIAFTGSLGFDEPVGFGSADTFRITAIALAGLPAGVGLTSVGLASFAFQLVPEPATAPLVLGALVWLLRRRQG